MENTSRARAAAAARWQGGDFEAGQAAQIGKAVFATWCARADLVTAAPSRNDVRPDYVVTDVNQEWMVPVVVTSVARDGMTVSRRVLDFPGALIWVFLGKHDGGLESRKHTHLVVLDPAVAWDLPVKLELERTPTQSSYRWPSMTEALRSELTDHTARDPGELRVLLEQLAWHRNSPSLSPGSETADVATPALDSTAIIDEHA